MIEGTLLKHVPGLTPANRKQNRESTLGNYKCFQRQQQIINRDITQCNDMVFYEARRKNGPQYQLNLTYWICEWYRLKAECHGVF